MLTRAAADDAEDDGTWLARLLAPLWSAERTCSALGISRGEAAARRRRGTLLGIRTSDGDYFYPLFQFEQTDDKQVRVRPALRPLLMTLRDYDAYAVGLVINIPADELEGLTPLEWARDGRHAGALVDYAQVLAAEWR